MLGNYNNSAQSTFQHPLQSDYLYSATHCGISTNSWNYNNFNNDPCDISGTNLHSGKDYGGYIGWDVNAVGDGEIVYVKPNFFNDYNFGKTIIIRHTLTSGEYIYSQYSHLYSTCAVLGQKVYKGELIAKLGSSGGGCEIFSWANPNQPCDTDCMNTDTNNDGTANIFDCLGHLHFEFKVGPIVIGQEVLGGTHSNPIYAYCPDDCANYRYRDPDSYFDIIEFIPHAQPDPSDYYFCLPNSLPATGGGTNCQIPLNLSANVTGTIVNFSWDAVPGAISYEVCESLNAFTNSGCFTVNGTSMTISGYDDCNFFYATVRAICNDGSESGFSDYIPFYIEGGSGGNCSTPFLAITDLGNGYIKANWNNVFSETAYELQYQENLGDWESMFLPANSNSTTVFVGNCSEYNFRLRTICDCITSNWSFLQSIVLNSCPTCNDGIQNGYETEIDCGGDCEPCIDNNLGIIGEVGKVTVSQSSANQWHTINLNNSYTNPIVVMGPVSRNGGHPLNIRVKNVGTSSFKYQMDEWDYLDGAHTTETIPYIVLEAGIHFLEDGIKIQAGLKHNLRHLWETIEISNFTSPTILTQCVTGTGGQAVTPRLRFVNGTSFQVRLQEEEANDGVHTYEELSWIALEQYTKSSGYKYEFGKTTNSVTHSYKLINFQNNYINPVFLGMLQTYDGGDPVVLRAKNHTYSSVQVSCEEETSKNAEIAHTTEIVGYAIFDEPSDLYSIYSLALSTPDENYSDLNLITNEAKSENSLLAVENANGFNLQVWPNPATHEFNVEYKLMQKSDLNFYLYDAMGNMVLHKKVETKDPGIYLHNFNCIDLSTGVYTLFIIGKEFKETRKLVLF